MKIAVSSWIVNGMLGLLLAGTSGLAAQDRAADQAWPLHGGTAQEQRYSLLTQIHRGNARKLGLAWSFEDFVVRGRTHRGVQSTPLAVDGVLYFTGPWSVVYAVDARTGRLQWRHDPQVDGNWVRKACCDAVNRGVAIRDERVYVGTLDGFLVALDIHTGAQRWRVDTLVDRSRSYTITGAPRFAGDNIVIGNGGNELGVRGYISAFDAKTGDLNWRFFTVPGSGPDEHPEIAIARRTWSGTSRWDIGGGGAAYDSMAYDDELDLLYVGTGNGSPWPAWVRSPGGGDNLYLSSILALQARTGKLKWHYQTTPADSWDYTATQHIVLANLRIDGKMRRALMQAPKNGFFYVLDRIDGTLISARNYTRVTWATGIDRESGRPIVSPAARYEGGSSTVTPSIFGGHNWQPMAFHPGTGLVYIPVLEAATHYVEQLPLQYRPGTINASARVGEQANAGAADPFLDAAPSPRLQSVLKAWNPITQKAVWQSSPMRWWNGGVLATAGGIVVQGGVDGMLNVFDAQTGDELTSIQTGTAIMAPPITYGVDGVQYIAVLAGAGGGLKEFPPGAAALRYENHERLLVFKLNGAPVPLPKLVSAPPIYSPPQNVDRSLVTYSVGRELFLEHCARCHAHRGVPNNYPNLWNLPAATYDAFEPIVLGGAMRYAGMPAFDDVLSAAQVRAIRDFIIADELRTVSGSMATGVQ